MTRSVVQNVVLLAVAIVVCVLGAEAFLRLFPQFLSEEARLRLHWQDLGRSETEQAMILPDPHFGFLFRPNFRGRLSRNDLDFTFNTDEHGFRNPSPWPARADVVVVGDSMAFGYGVDDEHAWPRLLAEALPAEVINLGLIGAAPQQYLRVLEAFGLGLRPKLVLFMLFPGNDLADAKVFQRWLDADSELAYEDWRRQQVEPPGPVRLWSLLERSYLAMFLRSARKALDSGNPGITVNFEDGHRLQLVPGLFRDELEMAQPGRPEFELVIATIERARAVSREQGSEFLVLLAPTKEEVYLPRVGEPAPPLAEAFRVALTKRGIDSIDLVPDFQAHSRDAARPLFYEIDGHPNADGYRLIARVVADYLRQFEPSYGLPDQPESTNQVEPRAVAAGPSDRRKSLD